MNTAERIKEYAKISFILLGVLFGMAIFSIIFLSMGNVSLEDIETEHTSSSSDFIATSLTSTLEAGNGITANTVQRYNDTWLDFDGVDDRMSFDIDNDSITEGASVLFFTNYHNKSTHQRFFSRDNLFSTRVSANTTKLTLYCGNGTAYGSHAYAYPPFDTTQMFTFRINKTGNCDFFINTDLNVSNSVSTDGLTIQDSDIKVGSIQNGLDHYLNGSIYDFRVFNKAVTNGTINYFHNSSVNGKNLGDGIQVYMLHAIYDDPTLEYRMNTTIFNQTVDYLYSEGYESITIQDYMDWVDGTKSINKKSFIFSFDDGLSSVYSRGYTKMAEKGYVGSLSIVPEWVDSEAWYMDWDEINELRVAGWEIVSHSVNHSDFLDLSESERATQFNDSKYLIQGNTTILPNVFVFPKAGTNSTIDEECLNYYDVCISDTSELSLPEYNFKQNNYSLDISRINVINTTTLSELVDFNVYDGLINEYNLNENNGTTAHDSSGNDNHGTITGATWDNDGVLVTLSESVDYTLNTATGLLTLGSSHLYNYIMATWTYSSSQQYSNTRAIQDNSLDAIGTYTDGAGTQLNTVSIAIILVILIGAFVVIWKVFASKNSGDSKGGNFA